MMKATVEYVTVPKDSRIIAISDIHGDLSGFKKLLNKVHFTDHDSLFIVGDFCEKGSEILPLVRYVMNLSKKSNVHIVCGNCDTLYEDVYLMDNKEEDATLLNYMLNRPLSILNDMCREINYVVNKNTDMKDMKITLQNNFKAELDLLSKLPVIIDTKNFTFVHGGLSSEDLEDQDKYACLKNDDFQSKNLKFSKYVVVGHWPVALYSDKIFNNNPLINPIQKIISIDGGNSIKTEGQINALLIDPSGNMSFDSYDHLPEAVVCDDSLIENQNPEFIHYGHNEVKILSEKDDFSECLLLESGKTIWAVTEDMYSYNGHDYCNDMTTYIMPLKKGDVVKVIKKTSRGYIVKKDGIVGWYKGELK